MTTARVILKQAQTYSLGGRRFIKDVPQIVTGDEVDQFKNNGYFHVTMLKTAEKKAAEKLAREEDETDEELEEKSSVKASKVKGLKKRN